MRALADLLARARLDRAARDRTWALAASFDLPFLPRPEDPSESASSSALCSAPLPRTSPLPDLTTDHLRRRGSTLARLRHPWRAVRSKASAAVDPPRRGSPPRLLRTPPHPYLPPLALDVIRRRNQGPRHPRPRTPPDPHPFEARPSPSARKTMPTSSRAASTSSPPDRPRPRRPPPRPSSSSPCQRRMGKTSLLLHAPRPPRPPGTPQSSPSTSSPSPATPTRRTPTAGSPSPSPPPAPASPHRP